MVTVSIVRTIKADHWEAFDKPLPEGCHLCQPEVHWSAHRDLIYFTYGELNPRHWLSTWRYAEEPGTNSGLSSWVRYKPKDGAPDYWREWYPFAFWSVKSESQFKRDHRPVFLDPDDTALLALWHDYCSAERWPNPLSRYAEYRITDGRYGRGYKPIYLKEGDWLLHEDGKDPRAMSTDELRRMQAKEPTP